MDLGSFSSSISSQKSRSNCRHPLQDVGSVIYIRSMGSGFYRNPPSRQRSGGDQFIPDNSEMDIERCIWTSKGAYRMILVETLMPNRSRILTFKIKSPAPTKGIFGDVCLNNFSSHQTRSTKQRRYIPQSAERTFDAPKIVNDYMLNLLDWGCSNVLSIALESMV